MALVTLNTLNHDANGSITMSTITIDPSNPNNPKPTPKPVIITGLTFLGRLSANDYINIMNATQTQLSQGNPQLAIWIDMVRTGGRVNLSDSNAANAKIVLVSSGLMTQANVDLLFAPGS